MSDELASARVKRENDNMKVNPVDLLRSIVHDIETGKLNIDGVMVLTTYRPTGEPWTFDSFRAGMTRMDELGTLALAQERCVRTWRTE
jgi:hypothetical protein